MNTNTKASNTESTAWLCQECGSRGAVEYEAGALVYDVVEQLRLAHGRENVICSAMHGISRVRVSPQGK